MKKQLLVLFPIGVFCIGIWVFVIISIFSPSVDNNEAQIIEADPDVEYNYDHSEAHEKEVTEEGHQLIIDDPVVYDTSLSMEELDYQVRGILPGDFADIAPDKLISIDKLLEVVNN